MQKTKIFIVPELFEKLFQHEVDLINFFHRMDDVYSFLSSQKNNWQCEIFFDGEELHQFVEMNIYEARHLLSYINDTTSVFTHVRSADVSNWTYYKLRNKSGNHFALIKSNTYINLFESKNSTLRVIGYDDDQLNLLRIHNFDSDDFPSIVSALTLDLNLLEVDIFLDLFVSPLYANALDYYHFKEEYLSFYTKFDWQSWNPYSITAPAHLIIQPLTKFYSRKNDDSHHLAWGNLMAFLNGGRYNKSLSELNSKNRKVNDVYQFGAGNTSKVLFVSIDTENGSLEIYDEHGVHKNLVYGIISGIQQQNRKYKIEVPKRLWLP